MTKTTEDRRYEVHDSFGIAAITRSSGGSGILFGSPIEHHHQIRLTISRGHVHRDLNHDSYYSNPSKELIEVAMSSAQFAELITSIGLGSGVPCTIRYVAGKAMPPCPPMHRREKLEKEFETEMRGVAAEFDDDIKIVEATLAKKSLTKDDKAKILAAMTRVRNKLGSTVPFIQSMFNENVEQTVDAAKSEIGAFFQTAVEKEGLEALLSRGAPGLPALEHRGQAIDVTPEVEP